MPDLCSQNMYRTLRCLTAREFDMLRLVGRVKSYPESSLRVIDVDPGIERSVPRTADRGLMTITSKFRCYLTTPCRLMMGCEASSAMGINYGPHRHHIISSFSNRLLRNLAGNAFHGWCCAGACYAAMRLQAELRHRLRQKEQVVAANTEARLGHRIDS